MREVGHRAQVALADRAEHPDRGREALVQQGDDHLGQLGADAGHALGVAVGQAEHRAADHVGWGHVALGDPVVEDQPVVKPLAFGRVKQERLAFADPGGKTINRLAAIKYFFHHRARLAHRGNRRRLKRNGLSVPSSRDDLRNSQVTSIEHDRH